MYLNAKNHGKMASLVGVCSAFAQILASSFCRVEEKAGISLCFTMNGVILIVHDDQSFCYIMVYNFLSKIHTLFGLSRMIRSAVASLSPFLIETLMSPVLLNYQSGVLIEFVKID
jgi:hypothetical protein